MSETHVPLSAAQILARLARLEQAQIATAAANVPPITGPTGLLIMTATNPAAMLAALPSGARRVTNPFSY